jgi:hypothetical protein
MSLTNQRVLMDNSGVLEIRWGSTIEQKMAAVLIYIPKLTGVDREENNLTP